ncbi:hormogonium polysaccharide biosynthesis glycosyltransferase HpsO [Thermocoleostomius sinensis]|uniref:Hormogonium polysaccharide biosynthesis glycosyltransferase HpsO n=1 Tax=Thermocoleostomius sinensis A174 TaxID=2016057 RepID=A0A9E9CAQ0_9CYAN|nr:hormogonium polysaccharide biosynthesis glycosyltransferase HpsO [Thermocoleostomius sinensis]WAL61277.1 hormogonium polysaccharide biosynthesis glycosyltransferase HpsO [Thermocoleostomius sinensis A174]
MKILIASHTYIVDLNCEKYRAMTTLGSDIEVTIVVPKYWQPGGVQKDAIESHGWQDGSLRVVPVTNFSYNNQGLLAFGTELFPLLRQFRPQIIQVEQGSKSLGYAELITFNRLLGLKAKNIFFTWWNLPYTLQFPVSLLETYNLRQTHGIITGNQDGSDILRQRGYGGPIQVLPQLGVDERCFRPQSQPELAAQLGIQPHDFVIGFVGRFVEEKGLLTLCDALGELQHHSDRPWKWLLLGRGPLKDALVEKATALGISDRLIWIESVPHDTVPNYINLMSTLVLPSQTTYQFKTLTSVGWKEQFGHVLIEAMACQVPVIGSDSGEIPHVITDTGLVFPEGQVTALRDSLLTLMHQPELAIELSKRGYQRAMKYYTNRAIAQQQFTFYQELLKHDD